MDDLEQLRQRDLEYLHQRFLDGDKSAILKAMFRSLMVRKTFVPQWVSDAFVKAYEDVCSAASEVGMMCSANPIRRERTLSNYGSGGPWPFPFG